MLYQSVEKPSINPISVLAFGDGLLIIDGHHRAYQALLAGQNTILLSGIKMVVMNYIISMRKFAMIERYTLFWI